MSKYLKILIYFIGIVFCTVPVLVLADTQEELQNQLNAIEQQIKEYTAELGKTQTQKATLANKIKQLQTKQKTLSLQIKQTTLQINKLDGEITSVKKSIDKNVAKEKQLNVEMTSLLRQMNEIDDNMLLTLASSDGLSAFANEIKNYSDLTAQLRSLRLTVKKIRGELAEQRNDLEDKKGDSENLLAIKSLQQNDLKSSLGEQNDLLTQTKGKESSYQAMIKDSQKKAAEIRNRIYELFNTGEQINFGRAVEIAKWASGLTGVRPALLLAILTQESNLGKNVGTCNRVGDPPEKSWKVVMKPERDQEPFKTITTELGLNIDATPVSCPMKNKDGSQLGWGGAMGPAQFIPSTWMGYRSKITALTGKSTANPWDIRDAFMASAIKLKSDGADGTDDGDWKAAMKYFSGSTNLKYRFYGDNVIKTATQYQKDIEALEN